MARSGSQRLASEPGKGERWSPSDERSSEGAQVPPALVVRPPNAHVPLPLLVRIVHPAERRAVLFRDHPGMAHLLRWPAVADRLRSGLAELRLDRQDDLRRLDAERRQLE